MPVKSFDSGLDPSRESVMEVPRIPLWSETGAYAAYDPAGDVGIWLHLGRFSYEPRLWHEAVIVYLPDGTRLAFKNYGAGDTSHGPAGALSSLNCLEPFRRWRFSYDGPARRVTNEVLYAGGLGHGPEERLQVELEIESVKPIWDLSSPHASDSAGDASASSHDQQLSRAGGRVVSADGELGFDGIGWRDHSRGPRDIGGIDGHMILGAWFPDEDRGFVATHLRTIGGDELRTGRVFGPDDEEPLSASLPLIDDPRQLPTEFGAVLPTTAGEQQVAVEVRQVAPITMQAPNDLSIGMVDEPGALVIAEGQARFDWDGAIGYGYVERSKRI